MWPWKLLLFTDCLQVSLCQSSSWEFNWSFPSRLVLLLPGRSRTLDVHSGWTLRFLQVVNCYCLHALSHFISHFSPLTRSGKFGHAYSTTTLISMQANLALAFVTLLRFHSFWSLDFHFVTLTPLFSARLVAAAPPFPLRSLEISVASFKTLLGVIKELSLFLTPEILHSNNFIPTVSSFFSLRNNSLHFALVLFCSNTNAVIVYTPNVLPLLVVFPIPSLPFLTITLFWSTPKNYFNTTCIIYSSYSLVNFVALCTRIMMSQASQSPRPITRHYAIALVSNLLFWISIQISSHKSWCRILFPEPRSQKFHNHYSTFCCSTKSFTNSLWSFLKHSSQ